MRFSTSCARSASCWSSRRSPRPKAPAAPQPTHASSTLDGVADARLEERARDHGGVHRLPVPVLPALPHDRVRRAEEELHRYRQGALLQPRSAARYACIPTPSARRRRPAARPTRASSGPCATSWARTPTSSTWRAWWPMARGLKMDATPFRTCVESQKYKEAVQTDVLEAMRIGAEARPPSCSARAPRGRGWRTDRGRAPYAEFVKDIAKLDGK